MKVAEVEHQVQTTFIQTDHNEVVNEFGMLAIYNFQTKTKRKIR